MTEMIASNMRKSRLSLSYIEAVASHAGFHVVEPKIDYDSVDGSLYANSGKRPRIEFQAKATSQDVVREDCIHFSLPVKNYNDLRIEAINPRILIVLIMPQSTDEWVEQTQSALCIRKCAYWMSLKGRPETSNTSSVNVQLPLSNVFNAEQLADMMRKTESAGAVC